jgi:hypothetical protein
MDYLFGTLFILIDQSSPFHQSSGLPAHELLLGNIVFQGRPSSPCSFHAASKSQRAVDRSYARVMPVVLNMPVCSRLVFVFFKDKDSASTSANATAARSRSSLERKAPPQRVERRDDEILGLATYSTIVTRRLSCLLKGLSS